MDWWQKVSIPVNSILTLLWHCKGCTVLCNINCFLFGYRPYLEDYFKVFHATDVSYFESLASLKVLLYRVADVLTRRSDNRLRLVDYLADGHLWIGVSIVISRLCLTEGLGL